MVSYRELYAMGATGRDDLELGVFWSNFKKPRFDQRFAGFGVPGLVSNSQRVHIYYHYGIRSQKTIPIMAFGIQFHSSSSSSSSVYGPSWIVLIWGFG